MAVFILYAYLWLGAIKTESEVVELSERYALHVFKKCGGLIENSHFVYSSGLHGDAYVNKDAVYAYPGYISNLARIIAFKFKNLEIDAVLGPALGGVILSQWTAYHLSEITNSTVLSLFAEKKGSSLSLRRGHGELVVRKNILVVEDVLTTGMSAKKVVELTRYHGGNVAGLGALWNRGGVLGEQVANPPIFYSIINKQLKSWRAEECSTCNKS